MVQVIHSIVMIACQCSKSLEADTAPIYLILDLYATPWRTSELSCSIYPPQSFHATLFGINDNTYRHHLVEEVVLVISLVTSLYSWHGMANIVVIVIQLTWYILNVFSRGCPRKRSKQTSISLFIVTSYVSNAQLTSDCLPAWIYYNP